MTRENESDTGRGIILDKRDIFFYTSLKKIGKQLPTILTICARPLPGDRAGNRRQRATGRPNREIASTTKRMYRSGVALRRGFPRATGRVHPAGTKVPGTLRKIARAFPGDGSPGHPASRVAAACGGIGRSPRQAPERPPGRRRPERDRPGGHNRGQTSRRLGRVAHGVPRHGTRPRAHDVPGEPGTVGRPTLRHRGHRRRRGAEPGARRGSAALGRSRSAVFSSRERRRVSGPFR